MNNEEKLKIGQYCKDYRLNELDVTLTSFANYFNENMKNINAFEYGRANNIKYLFYYVNYDYKKRYKFFEGLFKIL